MITNSKRAIDTIVKWIAEYSNKHGKKTLVVELCTDQIHTVVAALLCKKTRIPTICLLDTSLIHSEPHGIEMAKLMELPLITMNSLNNYESYRENIIDQKIDSLNSTSGLKEYSCIPSAMVNLYLMEMATIYGGLVVGSLTKDKLWARCYQKGCQGDLLPLGSLYFEESIGLLDTLLSEELRDKIIEQMRKVVTGHSCPIDDCTNKELEWANIEDARFGIVSGAEDPTKSREWQRYTGKQRKLLAKLHNNEKVSRHKVNPNIPICDVRNIPGTVR